MAYERGENISFPSARLENDPAFLMELINGIKSKIKENEPAIKFGIMTLMMGEGGYTTEVFIKWDVTIK